MGDDYGDYRAGRTRFGAAATVRIPSQRRGPGQPPRDEWDAVQATPVEDVRAGATMLVFALRREGVSCRLPDFRGRQGLREEIASDPHEVVVLDLDLCSPFADPELLVSAYARARRRVVVLAPTSDPDQVARVLDLGALAVVAKDQAPAEVLRESLAAVQRDRPPTPGRRHVMVEEARRRQRARSGAGSDFATLSRPEADLVRALVRGRSVPMVALTWCVSEADVRSHLRSALAKLGVTTETEAVARARRCGWS